MAKPRSAGEWVSGGVVSGAGLLGALLTGYALAGHTGTTIGWRVCVTLGVLLVFVGWGALFLRVETRNNLALSLVSVAVGLLIAEITLSFIPDTRFDALARIREAALHLGRRFDDRSQAEVIRDLRQSGVEAFPATFPRDLLREGPFAAMANSSKRGVLPLAGISDRVTVASNESGEFLVYRSDRHGFNNPDSVWNLRDLDLLLLGDSFTQGLGVRKEEGLAEVLRRQWPRTLNLGIGGDGPLLELGTLREYLGEFRPRVVLWMYFEGNDPSDLERESKVSSLLTYLSPGEVHHLAQRQPEIDSSLAPWLDSLYGVALQPVGPKRVPGWMVTLRLFRLRSLLGLTGERWLDDAPEAVAALAEGRLGLFPTVLQAARDLVASRGSKLYLVYLPTWDRYFGHHQGDYDRSRSKVLALARELALPTIDLTPIFAGAPRVDPLFAQGSLGRAHYSPEGYMLVARTVVAESMVPVLGENVGH